MIGPRGLGHVVVVAAAAILAAKPGMANEPMLFASPDRPGPQFPTTGRSLFDELFSTPSGYDIPYPFAQLIGDLDRRIAPERVRTALIPLGRSLQRYAADPHYFDSPRVVVAVTADATGADLPADSPRLKDRLFLGYQPAAEAIEVISYNEDAGRFEFQEITDYGPDRVPQVGYAAREICTSCHQAHAPIFPRPLWSESNANPAVADELAALGASYHGAPVRQGVDILDDFDQSTDLANQIIAINFLWDRACGDGLPATDCRAALLKAALRYRLTGARADWTPPADAAVGERLLQRMTALWPSGVGAPNPDLPGADPGAELMAGRSIAEVLDRHDPRDPEVPRDPRMAWRPTDDPWSNFAALAREIAMLFATADIVWLDRQLTARAAPATSYRTGCEAERLERGNGRSELRLSCGDDEATLRLSGFAILDGTEIIGGRIDALSLGPTPPIRRLRIVGGDTLGDDTHRWIRLDIRDDSTGTSPRLLSGERIGEVRLYDGDVAAISVIDDLDALDMAVEALARGDDAPLGPGPLRRRVVLAGLGQAFAER